MNFDNYLNNLDTFDHALNPNHLCRFDESQNAISSQESGLYPLSIFDYISTQDDVVAQRLYGCLVKADDSIYCNSPKMKKEHINDSKLFFTIEEMTALKNSIDELDDVKEDVKQFAKDNFELSQKTLNWILKHLNFYLFKNTDLNMLCVGLLQKDNEFAIAPIGTKALTYDDIDSHSPKDCDEKLLIIPINEEVVMKFDQGVIIPLFRNFVKKPIDNISDEQQCVAVVLYTDPKIMPRVSQTVCYPESALAIVSPAICHEAAQ